MADFPEIPGYKIVSKLNEGGMARVYLGIQEKLNRKVAVKILEPFLMKTKETAVRFEKEAKTAASLSHSNIIQIHDTGKIGEYHYIVMEYLEESLREKINRNPQRRMHPEIALDIIDNIMKALDYAHFRGVYHRDIKPENIMFKQDSTPVLVDFGIARVFDSFDELTSSGVSMGTACYMSPEQCRFPKKVDGRSDIYSLGVVLFEMLTGKKPYKGDSYAEVLLKQIEEPLPRLPQKLNRYQPLIDKMMAKDRTRRISSGPEFTQLLDRILTNSLDSIPLSDATFYSPAVEEQSSTQITEISEIPSSKITWFLPLKKSLNTMIMSFSKQLRLMKKKVVLFIKSPLLKKLLIGIIPAAVVLVVMLIILFNQGKELKQKDTAEQTAEIQDVDVPKDTLKTGQTKELNPLTKLKLANRYFEKAMELLTELEKTKNAQEANELKNKIEQTKDSEFNKYFSNARLFFEHKNYQKAKEHVSMAKQIKTVPQVLSLEEDINMQLDKIQKQLQEVEKDDKAFDVATSINNINAYRKYLAEFPEGRHIEKIRENLKKLKKDAQKQLKIKLRSEYKVLTQKNVESMIKQYDFFDYILNETGEFESNYEKKVENDTVIVIDHTTDLMWYDGPPPKKMNYTDTGIWIENLNNQKYGGYDDWRYPTLEEAASLLRKEKNKQGFYLDPIFSGNAMIIWTNDQLNSNGFYVILFHAGLVEISEQDKENQVRPVRSTEDIALSEPGSQVN